MKLEKDQLLTSKIYVKPGSALRFQSAKTYVNPFLDIVGPDATDIRYHVDQPVTNMEEDGTLNVAYPRVNIEATLGDPMTGFKSVIGMIYGLNTQIPIAKVYTGQSVSVCMNLCIFSAEDIFEQNLLGNEQDSLYKTVERFKRDKDKQIENYTKIYNKMVNNQLSPDELKDLMGDLLLKSSRSKLGTSPIVGAANSLTDPKSIYYVNEGSDFRCNEWNVYNAATQVLTDRDDVVQRPNKTMELIELMRGKDEPTKVEELEEEIEL